MVVIASGRFRNQMFQYAVAIIAKKNKTKVLIDDSIFKVKEKKNWVIFQEILSF
jgi:hypothetical protein